MTLLTRRITASFFSIVFLITAPIVLLYTSGYRYNFTKNKLEKTGVLFLDSEPSKVTIFLNNKKFKKETPAHIAALLPNEYHIELRKDGYLDWKKTLTVESAKTLFATQIFLPRAIDPAPLTTLDAENVDLSPSQKIMLTRKLVGAKTVFGLYRIDENKSTILGLFEARNKPVEVQWSPDSRIVVVHIRTIPDQFLVVDVTQNAIFSLSKFFDSPIRNIKFDYNTQDTLIVGTIRGRFRFRVGTQKKIQIDRKSYEDYVIRGGLFYAIQQTPTETNLISEEVITENPAQTIIIRLPRSSYEFLPSPDDFIVLKNAQRTLLLIRLGENPRIILEAQADDVSWKKLNNTWRLLYHNNFELWIFHTSIEEKELVTRLSTTIKKSTFLTDGEHILFLSNNAVRLTELDKRGGRNVWIIGELHRIADFAFDSDKFLIYFIGQPAQESDWILYNRAIK